jgi:hypothetical protein
MADQRHIRDDRHFGNIHDDLHLDSGPSNTVERPIDPEKSGGIDDDEMSNTKKVSERMPATRQQLGDEGSGKVERARLYHFYCLPMTRRE